VPLVESAPARLASAWRRRRAACRGVVECPEPGGRARMARQISSDTPRCPAMSAARHPGNDWPFAPSNGRCEPPPTRTTLSRPQGHHTNGRRGGHHGEAPGHTRRGHRGCGPGGRSCQPGSGVIQSGVGVDLIRPRRQQVDQITIQGVIVNRSLNFTLPITGGSGRYDRARGQVVSRDLSTPTQPQVELTFHLED
jgi:hypothetical protein